MIEIIALSLIEDTQSLPALGCFWLTPSSVQLLKTLLVEGLYWMLMKNNEVIGIKPRSDFARCASFDFKKHFMTQ